MYIFKSSKSGPLDGCGQLAAGYNLSDLLPFYPQGAAILNITTTKGHGVLVRAFFKRSGNCLAAAKWVRAALFISKRSFLLDTREGIHLEAVAPASMATTASRTAAAQARRSCVQAIPIVI